ncbi:MAG: hypothetical protein P4L46_17110 [Fimbriimonas sp.]|nr:hypothetical protein [Fimbriimonas sp.]
MRHPYLLRSRLSLNTIRVAILCFGSIGVVGAQTIDAAHLAGLKWRNIGPFRGGRVSAVTGVINQPDTFYIGLPEGGIWKTTSAGQVWDPIFDAVKDTATIGSIQVAQSNPNVVYAGTGEISGGGQGTGMYRSVDAGKTWSHIGLTNSKLVPSVFVDPHNDRVVLAAALGGAVDSEKGVYRTTDGGDHWTRVLFIDDRTGIQHLAWAFDQPSVIFASPWKRFRGQGSVVDSSISSGPEIYRSTDEGVTWKKIKATGLPKSGGRVTVAVAAGTHAQRLFLIGTFGLYRSDDGGTSWRQMAAGDSRIANGQGDYSSGVYVDPQNPDIVYTLATCVYRSLDGGETFQGFKGAPGGDDPHQLWINPSDSNHIILGGDQGATVSLDKGKTWGSWYNQATGQVYHVSTDNRFPYWVYATQQDSGCIGTSSRGNLGAITAFDWLPHPGNEGGYIVVDPLNPAISYAVGPVGGIIRVTYPSGQWVQVEPNMNPGSDLRGWSGQLTFNPSNPHELLMAFQYILSTTDGGSHWNKISPDLTVAPYTRAPSEKERDKGAAIVTFSASALSPNILWAGTSNGLIRLTKDHGKTWLDVSLPRQPGQKEMMVSHIEASSVDTGGAYAVVTITTGAGSSSHLFRTHNFGLAWTETAKGLLKQNADAPEFLSLVRSDPGRPGLLFALSWRHVFVSFDDGDSWQPLTLNLPTTAYSDLVIHGNDLVLGTFGRGMWILDDYAPLRQISKATVSESAHLYRPSIAFRLRRNVNDDTPLPPEMPHAENPPLGAVIYYSLTAKPVGDVKVEIVDSGGRVVRHFTSAPIEPYDDPAPPVATYWPEVRQPIPANVGLNRINWNIRYDTPHAFTHDVGDVMGAIPGDTPEAIEGPLALPGNYTVRLIVDGKSVTQPLIVRNDPRSLATERDMVLENRYRMDLVAGIEEAWAGYHQIERVRSSVSSVIASKPPDDVLKAANSFEGELTKVAGTVSHIRRFYGPPDPSNFAGLNGYLLARLDSFDYGDVAPTEPMLETYAADWSKLKAVSDRWRALLAKDLLALNALLQKHGLKPVEVTGPKLIDPAAPNNRYLEKPKPNAHAVSIAATTQANS